MMRKKRTLHVGSLGEARGSGSRADRRQSQTSSSRQTSSVLASHTACRAGRAGHSADGRALNDRHGAKFRSNKEVGGKKSGARMPESVARVLCRAMQRTPASQLYCTTPPKPPGTAALFGCQQTVFGRK